MTDQGRTAGIKGMAQIAIASSEPARLSAYYRDTLGLDVLLETAGMTFFGAGGVRLMIGPAQGARPGDKILYFEPEDFAAAYAKGGGVVWTKRVSRRSGAENKRRRLPRTGKCAAAGWGEGAGASFVQRPGRERHRDHGVATCFAGTRARLVLSWKPGSAA